MLSISISSAGPKGGLVIYRTFMLIMSISKAASSDTKGAIRSRNAGDG
jgi:hypothetical protein